MMAISYNTRKWMFIVGIFSMTCIAAMIILQITTKSNNTTSFYESHHHNQQPIQLLPTFRIRMEWLHIFVVLLYTAGLVSTTTTYIHWYFIPLAVLITLQLVYSTWLLLDKESYIREQLEMSWNDAYSNGGENNGILMNIQDQWHCQGFSSLSDHPASIINLPIASENTVVSPCYPFLAQTFGSVVFIWGIGLWVVKLIQAIGLVACYALYVHINYTFLSVGRIIIVEDTENNIALAEEITYTDEDENAEEELTEDTTTLVEVSTITSEKPLLLLTEE